MHRHMLLMLRAQVLEIHKELGPIDNGKVQYLHYWKSYPITIKYVPVGIRSSANAIFSAGSKFH